MDKTRFNVVSFSGGKDSTAMLLRMIEEKIPVDCVLFCDTGLEFPQMYEHLDRVEKETGISITRVKAEQDFEYMMFDCPVKRDENSPVRMRYGNVNGYGWAGPKMRWCTKTLKDQPRERFLKGIREHYEIYQYVGIAADEQHRLLRKCNQAPNHVYPLVEWNMTEADCLAYCYGKGYDWGGLYEHFHRVSCWCCPLQSLDELRKLRKHYPDLWRQLKEWDGRSFRTFRADYSVEELEKRFLFEEKRLAEGKPVKGKEFFTELRKMLGKTEVKNQNE